MATANLLTVTLPSDLEVKLTREFDAPRDLVFEDLGGRRTRIVGTTVFDSTEDRDGMVQSGMEQGAAESYNRLDAYLQTLARA